MALAIFKKTNLSHTMEIPIRPKHLTLALVAALLGNASVAQQTSSPEADLEALKTASYYAIGFTGTGGMQAPGQTALVHLHQSADRDKLMQQAYASGNLVAKVYVACWASSFDKKLHASIRDELLKASAESTVTTLAGSIASQKKVGDLLREMSSGQCGQLAVGGAK